jgi:hypothetical protein
VTPVLRWASSRRYRFLWLKYVTGVNLSQHCAKSLKGRYSSVFTYGKPSFGPLTATLDEFAPPLAYYLCGVVRDEDRRRDGARNLHLAFRAKPGATVTRETDDARIILTDAEEIEITDDWIDRSHECAGIRGYASCRNWWFAWRLAAQCVPDGPRRALEAHATRAGRDHGVDSGRLFL